MSVQKILGQIFTPAPIVEQILNEVNYVQPETILQSKILEPSFGNGAFLTEIVNRIIEAGREKKLSASEISKILESNIWGTEYDGDLYEETLTILNAILKATRIPPVKWNLYHHDALTFEHPHKYDFVVGNPPYVRIHNIPHETREQIKKFTHSSGTSDIYIIFFEYAIKLLNENGKLGYITPNSFLRNTSPKKFRQHVIEEKLLVKLIDFGSKIVFKNAATYTAITLLSKEGTSNRNSFDYVSAGNSEYTTPIQYDWLNEDMSQPWVFGNTRDIEFLIANKKRKIKLGDIANVQYAITTMRNSIYLSSPVTDEPNISRRVVKGGNYKGERITQQIIFPYKEVNGRFIPINESEFSTLYPKTYQYLSSEKERLLERGMDKMLPWYAYGRSQGLNNSDKPKLTIGHVIPAQSTRVNIQKLDADVVVYAGIFITVKPDVSYDIEDIKSILESEDFARYAKLCGKDKSGGFKEISTLIIKDYGVS